LNFLIKCGTTYLPSILTDSNKLSGTQARLVTQHCSVTRLTLTQITVFITGFRARCMSEAFV